MSQIDKVYVVRPNLGSPLILEPRKLQAFEITVAGKWPEVPELSHCGQPPTPQRIEELVTQSGLYLNLLPARRRVPLRILETPHRSALTVYDRWQPFAGIDATLYAADLPVSSQGIDLLMETIEHQAYFMQGGHKVTDTQSVYEDCFYFPVPRTNHEYHYAAGFRWECRVKIGVRPQDMPQIDQAVMAALGLGDGVNHHAVYITDAPPSREKLRLIHVTDTHVSQRNDRVPDILYPPGHGDPAAREAFLLRYRNFNDNLRAVIRAANRQARADDLDLVVITGDLVDYAYDNHALRPCRAHESNFRKFVEIITGTDGKGEALEVPLYVVPGNHEYLRYQIPLAVKVDPEIQEEDEYPGLVAMSVVFGGLLAPLFIAEVQAYYTLEKPTHGTWRLTEEEGRTVDRAAYGVPEKIGATLALAKLRPRAGQFAEYLEQIAYDVDSSIAVGPHQFVLLNTGEDLGTPRNKQEAQEDPATIRGVMAKRHLLNYLNDEPDCRGIDPWQVRIVEEALEAAAQADGRTLVFTHAPLLNLRSDGDSPQDYLLLGEQNHREAVNAPNMITAWLGWLELLLLRGATAEEIAEGSYLKPDEKESEREKPALIKIVDFFKAVYEVFKNWGEGTIYPELQGYHHINWWSDRELKHPIWIAVKDSQWQYRDSLRAVSTTLTRRGFPQSRTHHFKEGTRERGLDHGVAAGDEAVHALLRAGAGGLRSDRKVDLVLSGHTHHVHEFRVEVAPEEAFGNPCSLVWVDNNSQHVFYHGKDNHIHELGCHYQGGWYHTDLTQRTGAPLAFDGPVGFVWERNHTLHLLYVDWDSHIVELAFHRNVGWYHNDLTEKCGAPVTWFSPFGLAWEGDNSIRVYHQSRDGHVNELSYQSGTGWRHLDLTNETGAPLAEGRPVGHSWEGDHTLHVFYRGKDGRLHELWYRNADGWHHHNLTRAMGAPTVEGVPSSYAWEADGTQHVFFRGSDDHLHELWHRSSDGWHHHDLTRGINAPPPVSSPTSYVQERNTTQHVVYEGQDGHIHEVWYQKGRGWHHSDVSVPAAARPFAEPTPGSHALHDLAGHSWEKDDSRHIFYRGNDDHIHELCGRKPDDWRREDLTEATGGPNTLRFFTGDYGGREHQEGQKPILVTSSALKRINPRFRDVQIEDGRITSTLMRGLRPRFQGGCSQGDNEGLAEFHRLTGAGEISLMKEYTGWLETWLLIVPGNFSASQGDDLLKYDPVEGRGVFFRNQGGGNISGLRLHRGWRKTWSLITPGNFSTSQFDDLLCYDSETGEAEFYSTDGQGNLHLLKRHTGWRKTWSHIIAGAFGGENHDDLLFYDPTTGEAEVCCTDGKGNLRLLHKHTDWSQSWTHCVGMRSHPNYVFLFDSLRGEAELRYSSAGVRPPGKLLVGSRQSGIQRGWTHVVAGNFRGGGPLDDLLFYHKGTGRAEFCSIQLAGSLLVSVRKHSAWHRGWSLIVAGDFVVTAREGTGLLFYDRISW